MPQLRVEVQITFGETRRTTRARLGGRPPVLTHLFIFAPASKLEVGRVGPRTSTMTFNVSGHGFRTNEPGFELDLRKAFPNDLKIRILILLPLPDDPGRMPMKLLLKGVADPIHEWSSTAEMVSSFIKLMPTRFLEIGGPAVKDATTEDSGTRTQDPPRKGTFDR